MKVFSWLIAILIALASAAFAQPDMNRTICSFENQSDFTQFQVRKSTPPTQFYITSEHASNGSHAAQIIFPKWQIAAEENPSVIFESEKGMPRDWSIYNFAALDIYNPSSEHMVDITLSVNDTTGHKMSQHFYIPPTEMRTLHLSLDALPKDFDKTNVKELHISTSRPPEDISIIVDNIKLECDIEPRLMTAGTTLRLCKHKIDPGFPELKPTIANLEHKYRILSQRAASANSAEARGKLRSDISAFETDILRAQRAVDELQMRQAFDKISPSIPYACGFTSSMEKVFPKDVPFNTNVTRTAEVSLAGNETESVQLLILADKQKLKYTQVNVSNIRSVDGKETGNLPTVQISPVGFVKTEKPPYPVRYIGWYPDPILDFLTSFDIKKGDTQPVWIRVQTPTGTSAGDYIADVTVKPANANPVQLSLKIHVWEFDLPKENHLRNAMSLYDNYLPNAYGQVSDEMRAKYQDFVLSYRINPDNIYRATPPAIQDIERWSNEGLNAFNILHVSKIKDMKKGESYPQTRKKEIMSDLDQFVPELKKKGLYDKAYVYGFDEVNADSFAAMQDIFTTIKAKYPDLPLMTTAYDASYGDVSRLDCVDIWVPLTPRYDLERAQAARARGKQVWWYICISPKEPFANWLIEDDAIEARSLMGLQTVKYQPDGFLYYAMSRWPLTKKPITNGPYTDWPPASYMDCNGDGSVICAGPTGPLATIRLENIRDGIEDYEYFYLLQQEMTKLKGRTDAPARKALEQAEKAMQIGNDLVKDLTSFSKSPEAIYAKRNQVAKAIIAARRVAQP